MSAPWTSRLALCGLTVLGQSAVAVPPPVPSGATPATASPASPARHTSLPDERTSRLPAVQVAYLTSCWGCHGIEGVSAPLVVPTLRHLAGAFLCTRQGRQYLVRLPDVALSVLSDRMLTKVMNWVAFDLGAPAAEGRGARPYTVSEVTRLRREPLIDEALPRYRAQVIAHLAPRCTVPAGLRAYGGADGSGNRMVPRR